MTTAHTTGSLLLSYAALQENDFAALAGARPFRDSMIVRNDNERRFHFRYATVVFEKVAYTSVADAVSKIVAFEKAERSVGGNPAANRTIALRPDGGPEKSENIARILLCEAESGAVGATEYDAVYSAFLDFGEHTVAVSPAGIAIAGQVDDDQIDTYLYYVAQISAAVCRYAFNERILADVMSDIHHKAEDFDVEKLQEINISTSKAMLDISDELLNIPPRENFILTRLLSVANVRVYEERIARMLGIIQHYVQHRHALQAEVNSGRVEFVLFVIAIVGGVTGIVSMFSHSDALMRLSAPLFDWVLTTGAIFGTVWAALWFHRKRNQKKDNRTTAPKP
ncbi:MAG: hypothetical protein AB7K09_09165 [Planctomycetota bacterium]